MDIMTIRVPNDVKDELMVKANAIGITRNALVLIILNEWLKNNKSQ